VTDRCDYVQLRNQSDSPIPVILSVYEAGWFLDDFNWIIAGTLGLSGLWLDMWDPDPLPRITKGFETMTKDSSPPAGTSQTNCTLVPVF
jgi:hypothetical protein